MAAGKKKELLLLVLSNGLSFGELAATLETAKSSSKSCGSHRARELYWEVLLPAVAVGDLS